MPSWQRVTPKRRSRIWNRPNRTLKERRRPFGFIPLGRRRKACSPNRTKTFHVKRFGTIGEEFFTKPHTASVSLDVCDRGKNRYGWRFLPPRWDPRLDATHAVRRLQFCHRWIRFRHACGGTFSAFSMLRHLTFQVLPALMPRPEKADAEGASLFAPVTSQKSNPLPNPNHE